MDFETVDGGIYSIPGEGSYKLSDLLPHIIGKTGTITDAQLELIKGETVKGALYLTKDEEGEWYINSDVAFYETYLLTVTIAGVKYEIKVTDLQYTTSLNDVLTDLTISGAEWDASTESYTVKPGKSYTVNMTFQESEDTFQFSNNDWMTLNLPAGITFEAGNTFSITVNEAGENFTVTGNQVEAVGGSIRIKLNDQDPNYQKLKDITTAKFTVSVTGQFNSNHNEYTIDGQTDTKIKVDNTPDVNVSKSGTLIDWNSNPNSATVKYRLEVRSNGAASGVEISDVIAGTGLSFDGVGSISVKEGNDTINNWQKSQNGNGFKLITGDLEDGKTYVVEYTATINKSQLVDNGDGTYDLGANNTVTWPGKPSITNHDLDHVVRKPGISKAAAGSTQSGSVTTTTWRIDADSDYGPDNQLKTITDRLGSEGMAYSGTGIHVVITDKDTNTVIYDDTIPWSQTTKTDNSWSFDVSTLKDNLGKKYHYTITYDTTYDIGNATTGQTISNEYEDNRHNEGTGQAWINPNPENRFDLEKQFTSKEKSGTDTIVTWTIKVTVPAAGLTAADAILTDVLPATGAHQDTYYSFDPAGVTGLYSGESVTADTTSDPTKVVFTFKNGGNAGLRASSDGKAREIVLTLKTKCDPDWLTDEDAEPTHTNEAIFHNIHKYAFYTPDKPSIKKEGWRDGEDGGLPKFSYSITAGVFSKDMFNPEHTYENTTVGSDANGRYVEIVDTFDARLVYVDGSATVGGGDQYSQENGRSATGITASASGNQVTFRLYENTLPKNGTNLYQYYKVNYSLKVASTEALEELRNEAISTGKAVKLGNSVTGFGGNEITVDYEPKILDKSHQIIDDKLVFTVKVNEEGLTLSDDGVLVLTDEMTNLSVRYQDITIEVDGNKTVETTDADGNPVTAPYFNMKGNTITFYIPDGAPTIITYRATPRGEVGPDGKINYSNTVKLKGFEKTDSGSKDYVSEASGYGTNYGVYIYKADGNVNSNALAGAVFKLYEADEVDANGNIISGTPVKGPDGSDYTVTTSDGRDGSQKGIVAVIGTEELGWNLKPEKRYYLLEVEAPEGYALDPTKYQFIISKDGYVNYTARPVVAPDGSGKIVQAWTYHNGDVMTVKNWRKDGVLTLEKSFSEIDPYKMDDDQKSAIKFEIYTIDESGDQPVETLWRTITFDQLTDTDNDGKYSYTIGDLPEGKYRVKEIVNDETCTNTVYAITDPDSGAGVHDATDKKDRYATVVVSAEDVRDHTENKVFVTNTYNLPSEFKIFKHAEGETSYRVAGAKFGVFAIDSTGTIIDEANPLATYTTNARGRFTILQSSEESSTEFTRDRVYALKETEAPAGFEKNENTLYFCFLSEGKTALDNPPSGIEIVYIPWKESKEETVTDKPKTTYLEATKIYLDDLLEPTNNVEATSVDVLIKQIASYDKAGTIIEDALSGYYKYNADGPVRPVTAEKATRYKIVKDGDPATWHLSGDGVVGGKLQNLPTMTFDNHIPIYYTYQVEEINTGTYIPMYEYEKNDDGGTSATVTNKPDTDVPVTRVTAKKKWVDVEGNDITSKMGIDEGVSVDVYRYPGMLTRGTIYEADGQTVRDAGQQYVVSFKTGNNGSETTSLLCLPGDRIRYKIKALGFQNNNTINTAQISVRCNQLEALGQITKTIDAANNEITFEFDAPTDNGNRSIYMEIQQVYPYILSVENITSIGRTQVLTQADLVALDNKMKVETLELNKANGWTAVSKEYVKRANNVDYTYFVVEPEGATYEAEYRITGDTITTVNVDKKLEMDKRWLASNGDDITANKEDGTITYHIMRNTYVVDPSAAVTINYSNLKAAGTNVQAESIASNIKVGATIKVTVKIKDRTPNAENSPLDGMEITGGTVISSTSAYRVNTYNPTQYDWMRDYFIEVTDPEVVLSGNLVTLPDYGSQTKLSVSIQKEPAAVISPDNGEHTHITGEPEEIGTVTVSYDSIVSYEFNEGYENATVTEGSTPWSAVVNHLPAADDQGDIFTYTVEEVIADNFEQVRVDDQGNIVVINEPVSASLGGKTEFVNRLKPGYLEVHKDVEGADPGKQYEIAVTDINGNYYGADGKNYGSTPHYEHIAKDQTLRWDPLTPGTYTVHEKNASEEGYTWTVSGTGAVHVEQGQTATATVTNSYFKNTEYTPKITKSLRVGDTEVDPWPENASFDFYLTFVNGVHNGTALDRTDIVMHNREVVATEAAKTGEFGLIEFKKSGTYTFTIEEVEPAGTQNHKKNGIVYSTDKVTLTVEVGEKEGEPGVLEVKNKTYSPANGEAEEGLIINQMDYPTYAPSVTKSLKSDGVPASAEDWSGKSFTFDLANTTTGTNAANVIMPTATDKTVTADSTNHKETFDAIAFKAAGTYTFTVTERKGGDSNVEYDTTAKTISVLVEADDDGNLSVTKVTINGTEITGESIISSGVTVENTIVKNGSLSVTKAISPADDAAKAADKTFTFEVELKNADNTAYTGSVKVLDKTRTTATEVAADSDGKITVTVAGTGTATISEIPVGTKYVVTEPARSPADGWVQDGAVVYGDNTRTIAANDADTATVTNKYDASTTFTPKAKKTFTNGTITNNQFKFILTEVDNATATTAKTGTTPEEKTVSSTAPVSFTAIEYKLSDLDDETSKTYYYTIKEDIPAAATETNGYIANGIKYDNTVHRLEVTVSDAGDGTLNKVIKLDGETVEEASVEVGFTNEQLGKLQIKKEVKYNNNTPPADKKALFAGTYTFTVCTDEQGSVPYPNAVNPMTFEITIGQNAEAAVSEIKELPAGDYWIKENVAEDAQILPLGANPQKVTINPSTDNSATQAIIHTVTNDLEVNEEDDDLTLDIKKKFEGINNSGEIPSDFQLVITYMLGGSEHNIVLKCENSHITTDGLRVNITHSEDQKEWEWHVYNINESATDFKIKEVNYTKPGYELSVSYNGTTITTPNTPETEQPIPLTAGAATMTETVGRTTSQINMSHYILTDDYVVLVAITGNVQGTAVVSKRSLNMAERDAIARAIPLPNGPFTKEHLWFYSEEEHFVEGQDVTVTPVKNRDLIFSSVGDLHIIKCPSASNKQAVAYTVSYDGQPSITNATYVNTYTPKSTTAHPEGTKELSGRDWNEGDSFSFTLTPSDATKTAITNGYVVMPTVLASNQSIDANNVITVSGVKGSGSANASVIFPNITFRKVGTYTFTMKEVVPAEEDKLKGVTYAVNEVAVTFTVTTDPETGDLVATPSYSNASVPDHTDSAYFINKYEAEGPVDFKVTKNFKNGTFSDAKKFEFKLTQVTTSDGTKAATAEDVGTGEGKIPALVLAAPKTVDTTDASGSTASIVFKSGIKFNQDQVGTYYFLIEEVVPTAAQTSPYIAEGIQYPAPADAKKVITVTVEDKGDGTLTVKKNGTEYDASNANADADTTFTNEELTDFTFYKVWHNETSQVVEWGDDVTSITVTVGRKAGETVDEDFSFTYEVPKTAFTATGTDVAEKNSTSGAPTLKAILVPAVEPETVPQYKFYLENLPKTNEAGTEYVYFVKEQTVNGYNTSYAGSNGNVVVNGTEAVDDGHIINKPVIAVSLPVTGGAGTIPYTTAGGLLMASTALAYIFKKKRFALVPVDDDCDPQAPRERK